MRKINIWKDTKKFSIILIMAIKYNIGRLSLDAFT